MQAGDFEGALAMLAPELAGPKPDPAQLLMAFNLEVRLQRFDEAARSIRRVIELAPQVAEVMGVLAKNALAEAAATRRLTDPVAAGKRATLGTPPAFALVYVKAAVCHAQQDYAGAAAALAEAKPMIPATPCTLTWRNGKTAQFADVMDSDDLTGPILPCYDGATLVDLPYCQLRSVTFADAKTSFDVMWVPAQIVPVTGKPFIAKVPALHAGTGVASMTNLRLGQLTMWERDHGYAEAIGQRDLKLLKEGSMSMVGLLQVRKLELDAAAEPEPKSEKKGFWKKLVS